MATDRRRYTEEFKREAVQLMESSGKPIAAIARELGLTEKTVLLWRHRLQAQAEALQPPNALPDQAVESDEMFQNAGEKGIERLDRSDRPRRRVNIRRGRGTFAHDRPPVLVHSHETWCDKEAMK